MKCKYCGKETSDDSVFCEHCGKQLINNKLLLLSNRQKIILCVATVLGIALGLVIAFAIKGKDTDTLGLQQANNAVEISKSNMAAHNENGYSWLQAQKVILGAEKVKDAEQKAIILKQKTDALIGEIEQIKKDLIIYVDQTFEDKDGLPKTAATVNSPSERGKTTRFMKNGNAGKLEKSLDKYRMDILSLTDDPNQRNSLSETIGLNEQHNYNGITLSAAIMLLNATEEEVRNAESKMLEYIKSSVSTSDFKFDNLAGCVIPMSRMVMTGDKYMANVFVSAYDTKSTPKVYYKVGVDTLRESDIPSATELEGENGLVRLELNAGGLGEKRFAGLIKIKAPDGTDRYYSFSDRYTVVKPSATISAEKMNVLYAGIANLVSVSAPVAPDQLSVNFPGCVVNRSQAGKFNVSVPQTLVGKTVEATVSTNTGGKTQAMGSTIFRVKRVPDPRATIGANIRGGKRSKGDLTANPFIRAAMGDDFAYDLKWTINSYLVIFIAKGYEEPPLTCTGANFSDAVKDKIAKSASGTTIVFTSIKASSVAGQRTLDEITVRLK